MADRQIGIGKSARRGYALDEVSIVPSRRTRDADEVDSTWQIDAFTFDVPLALAGPDPVEGALNVVDIERFAVADGSVDLGAVREAMERASNGGPSAVSVRPQRALDVLGDLRRLDPDLVVIAGRVVSAEHVAKSREPLNLKRTVRELEMPVIVGACSSYQAALHLMRTGAAGVLIGGDPRSSGVGVPLATAIADARGARMQHLDETGVYAHLIAAGTIRTGGDVARAVVCGADAVWLSADDARVDSVPAIVADLRRSMATCGYDSLKEFQTADLVVVR
ncbi:MAG TPA: IMP dehydrogenase [Microthrixaceae bacterium]|nr:IMP dehydrogenase [Microthrixaceae bacterium]HMT22961.1 IMP dehydrogenase [Microthrixaceae bacterium]HMT61654.1 IMP dehydrogenase [Microthrixaceae bacterium]